MSESPMVVGPHLATMYARMSSMQKELDKINLKLDIIATSMSVLILKAHKKKRNISK